MSTTSEVAGQVAAEKSEAQLGPAAEIKGLPVHAPRLKWINGGFVIVVAIVLWLLGRWLLGGRWTLTLDTVDVTTIHTNLNTWPEWVAENQNSNPLFLYFINYIQIVLENSGTFVSRLFSHTDVGLGIPEIGWLGTTVLVTFVAYAIGNVRVAVLTAAVFLCFVLQGLWPDAMDTFALVVTSVFFAFLIGLPLGIWAGTSNRVHKILTPVLDFMQILPALAYLAPLVLIFSIGPASATAATLIFAIPPIIRITAHGIRQVPAGTREAVESLGVTRWQRLHNVLLPLAKRTIVIGMNQTIMAALAMVTIASFIGAPGLGVDVSNALQSLDVGGGFNAGLAIVLMAICFDRVSTAASVRAEVAARRGSSPKVRWIGVGGGLVVTLVAVYLSRSYLWAAQPPQNWPNFGTNVVDGVNAASSWVQTHLSFLTSDLKDAFADNLLNPLESLLTGSPFFLVIGVFAVIAWVAGGWRTALVCVLALLAVVGLGVWSDAMITLASTLWATAATMIVALVLGVWMGRSKVADRILRPVLDAAQTMPAYVYLIPFLGLFQAGRVTAIVAALVYAVPPAIKIIADGISQVPPNTVEAALSNGSTRWQMITKVQLPMSRKAVGLAANQAVIYTLSMVVIGAAVGAGALGYDVLNGLNKLDYFGKGLAAGLALVALGIALDRITQAAAEHSGRRAVRA